MFHEGLLRFGRRAIASPLRPVALFLAFTGLACGCREPGIGGPLSNALQIITSDLPIASTSTSYSANLMAQGGHTPYSWSLASGALPSGLTLQGATGRITGTPGTAGTSSFVARVRDSSGDMVDRVLELNVSNAPVAEVSIAVTGATFQTWRGWRFTARGNRTPDAGCHRVPDAVLTDYLGLVVNDLGFNGVRLEQHRSQALEASANDDADPLHLNMAAFTTGLEAPHVSNSCAYYPRADVIERTIVPMRSLVLARGEPFDLYLSFVYFNFGDMPAWWRSDPLEAAEAVEAFITWFRQYYGFDPAWFTYNEPSLGGHFDSAHWMGRATVAIGQRLASMGAATKIEQPSLPTPASSLAAFDNVVEVPGATPYIKRVAYHSYDYTSLWPNQAQIASRNDLRSRARAIGAETAMTEICCRSAWNGGYDTGLAYVRDIFLNMTEGDISIWEPLGIYNNCSSSGCVVGSGSGQNLINLEPDLSTYYLNPAYWVTRQFSRYIRPGYVRVGLNCSGCEQTADRGPNLKAVAWRSPSNAHLVSLINDSGGLLNTTVSGLPAGDYEIHKLDPTRCVTSGPRDRCTPVRSTQASSGSITVTLPVNAVWTLRQLP